MVKVKPKRHYTWEKDFLRGGAAPLGLGDAAFEDDAVGLALGAIGDQESDDEEIEREREDSFFSKNPNICARRRRGYLSDCCHLLAQGFAKIRGAWLD